MSYGFALSFLRRILFNISSHPKTTDNTQKTPHTKKRCSRPLREPLLRIIEGRETPFQTQEEGAGKA